MKRRPPIMARVGRLIFSSLLAIAFLAPLLANDRPLMLSTDRGLSLPALGELPGLEALLEQPVWRHTDWRRPVRGEKWRWAAPIPFSYRQTDLSQRLSPPSWRHLLGTDRLGRDLAARIVHGAVISLKVGLISTSLALGTGLLLGALAGFAGGVTDFLVSRLVEVVLAFPVFFLILAVLSFRSSSMAMLYAVIGLTRWPPLARYARGEILRLKTGEFVDAARASGAGSLRILWRHILPQALTPMLVASTFQLAGAMLLEAGLSFLGFGAPPPLPAWGTLLSQAQGTGRWWLVLFPGLALAVAVTGAQMMGEGFRDSLDPRMAPPGNS